MNLPNLITIFRIILIVPFSVALKLGYNLTALFLFLVASISDFLDGYIARKYNLTTMVGRLLDPLADKILYFTSLYLFLELKYINSFPVILIFFREFIAAATGPIILMNKNFKLDNIIAGRLKNVFQFISTIAIIIFKDASISSYLINTSAIVTVISVIVIYFQNFNTFNSTLKNLDLGGE